MKPIFISVLTSLILCFACFHAPSPAYLRPGHPEWPVGWLHPMSFDSLKNQYSDLKKIGISCVGMTWKETSGREKEMIRFCRNRGMKIYLTGCFDSSVADNLRSLNDPESIHIMTTRLQKTLSVWATEAGGFPVDVIPAIQIHGASRIPVQVRRGNQNSQPAVSEIDPFHGSNQDYRILQQIIDHLVPGLLIIHSTDLHASVPEMPDTSQMIGIFSPRIDSFPSEKLQDLRRHRTSWKRFGILCIPDVRESVLIDADRLPSGSDSLFHQLRLIAPDAVVWEHSERWPDSWQKRIESFLHFLRIQEISPNSR